MRQVLIIADDLSGAADCGIAFAASGLSAVVALRRDAAEPDVDVLSVDGDTRRLSATDAAQETVELMRHYGSDARLIFKKLDSTLRGNVATELAAMLRMQRDPVGKRASAGKRTVAVMAPAFPAHGRTTSQGRQLLKGRPLEELDIWKREGRSGTCHIPEMLGAAGLRAVVLGLGTVRSSGNVLRSAMTEAAMGSDVLVCDAETDDDLRAIAAAGIDLGPGTVWAGSAGLAYALPQAARVTVSRAVTSPYSLASGPALFVVGSVSRTCGEQVQVLRSQSDVVVITIPPEELLAGSASSQLRDRDFAIRQGLQRGQDVAIVLGIEDRIAEDGKQEMDKAKGQKLCFALGQVVAPHAGIVGALVATGGETARAVLLACKISQLRLVGEVEAGLPFSVSENWTRHLPVLTKAGDFGDPRSLLHCQEFLHGLQRGSPVIATPRKGF